MLEDASINVQIPESEKQIWLARLANEQGNYSNRGFRAGDADACFKKALLHAQKLPAADPNAQIEIIRARIGIGTNRARGRRAPRESDSQQEERRIALEKAIQALEQLQLHRVKEIGEELPAHGLDSAGTEVLRARSYLGLAALAKDGDERSQQTDKAVDILEAYLANHTDNSFVRMELVTALGKGSNDQGGRQGPNKRSPDSGRSRPRQNVKPQFEKALTVLRPLRDGYPNNPTFAMAEIRIRHRLAFSNMRRGRLDEAKRQLKLAIELQTVLVDAMPDNAAHRCWRALLNYSLSEALRDSRQPVAADAAIENARQDLAVVSEEHSDHPMLDRVKRTLSGRVPPAR